MTKDFLSILFNGRPGNFSGAAISDDRNFFTGLGLDGESNLVKVGEFLSTGSFECLVTGIVLIGRAGINGFDRDIKKGDQECQFVDNHIFAHALAVAFKAFAQRFGIVFVRVVGHQDNGAAVGFLVFACLAYVFAD